MSNRSFADVAGVQKPKAKAKHVVLCYMSGGVSQVDSFDPKPKLHELHGKPMPVKVERTGQQDLLGIEDDVDQPPFLKR